MQHTHSTPPTHLLHFVYFFTRYPLHSIIILQCFERLIHLVAKKLCSVGANISREFITWRWRHGSQHFSPGASECELTSEAYSLTDGNWPEGSVSLRRLLYYLNWEGNLAFILVPKPWHPRCPWCPQYCPKHPRFPRCPSLSPSLPKVPEVSKVFIFRASHHPSSKC